MGHSSVNMMVWCYSLIVGEVSVVYLAMVPDCKDIIHVQYRNNLHAFLHEGCFGIVYAH